MTYRLVLFSLLAASGLFAAAQKGTVRFGGLPVPGATVTATNSEKKISTVTGVDGRAACGARRVLAGCTLLRGRCQNW